jgi:hypothetical protein
MCKRVQLSKLSQYSLDGLLIEGWPATNSLAGNFTTSTMKLGGRLYVTSIHGATRLRGRANR